MSRFISLVLHWRIAVVLTCVIAILASGCASALSVSTTDTAALTALPAAPASPLELIVFHSPLWSTCREVMPIVSGIGREYQGRIKVTRVNIHNAATRPLQEEYGFTATPEFFLVNAGGKILAHWDGEIKLATLRPLLDKYLTP